MNPVSPFPAVISVLAAIGASQLLLKKFGLSSNQGRYASLDGLRGYLAVFVFLHHSCVWYFYLRTGLWKTPPSNLYIHLGESSVALFFMLTAFLFFSKLLDAREKMFDWKNFFISRFFRLVPLYIFAMLLFFAIVTYLSGGVLREPLPVLLDSVQKWLFFTASGSPDLNGVKGSFIIVAGVTWSLPYEWYFYMALPVLAVFVRPRPPLIYIILGAIGVNELRPPPDRLIPFLGGIAAAYLVRSERFCKFAASWAASLICITSIAAVIFFYPSAYEFRASFLLSIAFVLIAGGNSLWGTLIIPAARMLGEMAYSVYLLHGIVLFVTFKFIVDIDVSKTLTSSMHWLLIVGVTPVIVSFCFITFRVIERPFIQFVPTALNWLRSRRILNPPIH